MPATEVELDDGYESLGRVVDGGDAEEKFGMTHETARNKSQRGKLRVRYATSEGFPRE